jgi:SAM-dependent methyltransferase
MEGNVTVHDSTDIQQAVQSIRRTFRGFRHAQIYITFAELGIGPALDGRALTITDLAKQINADPAALRRFAEAAIAFGLMKEAGDATVELTSLGGELYAPSSENSAIHSFQLEGAFYRRWGRLTEAVQAGGRPEANRAQEDKPGWVRMFTMALYENSRKTADAVARTVSPSISFDESSRSRILDLGGGHGGYSIALATLRPDIDATVFDLPPVIEVTREIVARTLIGERVRTVAGDFHCDPLGGRYDVVLLFGVLHGETPEGAVTLLKAVHSALVPHGQLLIRSQGRPQGESETGEREIFDLHMLLSTEGGRVHRATDTRGLVVQHGFRLERELEVESPGRGQIMVFRKVSFR